MASMFDLNDRMLSPPSSPSLISSGGSSGSGHQHHTLGDQRALEKLALELSMLDLSELNAGNPELCQLIGIQTQSHHASNASAALAAALMSPQSQQQHSPGSGLVAGSTLNAFTSMLVAASADDRSKKSQNMTECVPVPSSEHVAEIVGRQGCKIKALRAKTNTYIKTPVRGEEPVFVVTGRKEDVAKAKREILSAAEHFSLIRASRKPSLLGGLTGKTTGTPPGPPTNIPGQITIQVRVPYRVVGLVVGPKGATIKHIQQQTHTYIVTPSRDKEPVFEVTGMPENVESARRQIEAHIALRTGNQAQMPNALQGLLNDDNMSPSQEFLTSLYKNGLSSLLGYLEPNEQEMEHAHHQPSQMTSSTGSSTCSSNSSTSSKSASMMIRPEMIDIWKTLGNDTSLDCDEGLGDSPINIWSLPNSASLIGSRASPSESNSPTIQDLYNQDKNNYILIRSMNH